MIARPTSGRGVTNDNKEDLGARMVSGKAGTSAAPRRFGTAINANTLGSNKPISSGPSKPAATSSAPTTSSSATSSTSSRPASNNPVIDNVTAADVAGALDIDFADRYNEMAVTEYVEEIYSNLRRIESELAPPVNYMAIQDGNVNERMRAILIDWLVEVHLKFKLRHETLFLTVNILDRFLAVQKVTRQRLQLVGVVSLMIAAKYEEIYAPEVRDYVYICDNAYTGEEIVQMEQLILSKLSFRLTVPTPRSFLKRFCKAAQGDSRLLLLVSYILELCLVDNAFLQYRPSLLCASATSLALSISGRPAWSPTLAKHTRYVQGDLEACIEHMAQAHAKAGSASNAQKAVHKKYSSSRFHSVAALPTPTNL